jgi:hypothetical protein
MKIHEEEIWNWTSERKTVALRGTEIIIPSRSKMKENLADQVSI